MISLSPEKLAAAKAEAKELLEYSIFVTAATLAVDIESIDGEYANPHVRVDGANNDLFEAHESLRAQIAAFNLLNG